jgi:hypothetical protein
MSSNTQNARFECPRHDDVCILIKFESPHYPAMTEICIKAIERTKTNLKLLTPTARDFRFKVQKSRKCKNREDENNENLY